MRLWPCVAQDLVRLENGTHSHNDIPSVHGSGAIGLKTVQSQTSRLFEAWTANSQPLSTLKVPMQPWRLPIYVDNGSKFAVKAPKNRLVWD